MIVLSLDDFKDNQFELAQADNSKDILEATIENWEKTTIIQLLGIDLGNRFITEYESSGGLSTEMQELFDPWFKNFEVGWREWGESCGGSIRESKGMKYLLQCVVFYNYVFDTQTKHSQTGTVIDTLENSNVQGNHGAGQFAETKYNNMIPTWRNIQWFIANNEDTYPEWTDSKGVGIRANYGSLL